jgi:hypothetical protein
LLLQQLLLQQLLLQQLLLQQLLLQQLLLQQLLLQQLLLQQLLLHARVLDLREDLETTQEIALAVGLTFQLRAKLVVSIFNIARINITMKRKKDNSNFSLTEWLFAENWLSHGSIETQAGTNLYINKEENQISSNYKMIERLLF